MRNVTVPTDFAEGRTSRDALRLGMGPERAPALLAMAQSAYRRGDLDSAYDAAFLAASCDRLSLDAWLVFGAICTQLGAFLEAEQSFRTVLASSPDHLGAHTGLGEALIAKKDFSAAAQALQKVVQLDPSGTAPASLRARMLLVARGQWKLGLSALSR